MELEVSIVTVSMDTRDWLRQCLNSLYADDEVAKEIIVVENCSEDGSAEMVRQEFPQVHLIGNDRPFGFPHNNNTGAQASSAPVLLFLNPDTKVLEGSLRQMLEVIRAEPECGVFGGKLLNGEGNIERSTGTFPTLLSVFLDRLLRTAAPLRPLLDRYSQRHYRGYDSMRRIDWVTGAYFWIRRDLLNSVGGWDSDFFMYYEDADLCYRIRQAGYRTLYVPQSVIYHYHNKTPLDQQRRKALMKEGFRNFARKHHGPVTRWFARLY